MCNFNGFTGKGSLAGFVVYALSVSLETDLNFFYLLGVFPLVVFAGLMPLTGSGIGTRDSARVILLSKHLPTEEATLVGFGYTVLGYWLLALIGLPAMLREVVTYFRTGYIFVSGRSIRTET